MNMRVLLVVVMWTALGCGSHPPVPKRWVVEGDLGSWKFRRFQGPMLDIEVWIDGNKAEAYTASYITAEAEKRGRIEDKDLVSASVTRYATPDGVVRATVKFARRLAQDQGYRVEEDNISGARTLTIIGHGEAWVIWPSTQYVVKVGGRRTDVPASMVASYVDRYPSQLPGGSLEGALPPGPGDVPDPSRRIEKPEYDPKNPRPDVEHYDPGKVKLPDQSKDGDAAPAAEAGKVDADAAKPVKPKPKKK